MPAGGAVTATAPAWWPIVAAGAASVLGGVLGRSGPPPANKSLGPPVIGDKVNTTFLNDPTADGRHYIGPDGSLYRIDNAGQMVASGSATPEAYQQALAAAQGSPGMGGGGGEGAAGAEGGGASDRTTFDLLSSLGFTPQQIGDLLRQGFGQVQEQRDLTREAIGSLQGMQGNREAAGNMLINNVLVPQGERVLNNLQNVYERSSNLDVRSNTGLNALSNDMFRLSAYQIYQDLSRLVGPENAAWINIAEPRTLQTLVDTGTITAAEARQLGDPSSPLATHVGTIQEQFARQGGMRAMAGPYLAQVGEAQGSAQDALANARSRANIGATQLWLQGQQIGGQAATSQGNVLNQGAQNLLNTANFMYNPSLPIAQGTLAQGMPTNINPALNLGQLFQQGQIGVSNTIPENIFGSQPIGPNALGATQGPNMTQGWADTGNTLTRLAYLWWLNNNRNPGTSGANVGGMGAVDPAYSAWGTAAGPALDYTFFPV